MVALLLVLIIAAILFPKLMRTLVAVALIGAFYVGGEIYSDAKKADCLKGKLPAEECQNVVNH